MNNKFKIGDFVTRKKYNNDIVFKVVDIVDSKYILRGVDLRLYADSYSNDLVLTSIPKKKDDNYRLINLDITKYFYIPGIILHLDSDKDYLNRCLDYYKKQGIKYYGFLYDEKEYKNKVKSLIEKYNPGIIVITGHDAYYKNNKYRNSKYFIETVREIRKQNINICIVAGACQSDYEGLIKAGANFASSPSHINIHALDPAIISSYISLSNKNENIDLIEILSKTMYGSDGIGGICTNGTMIIGYPRKKE